MNVTAINQTSVASAMRRDLGEAPAGKASSDAAKVAGQFEAIILRQLLSESVGSMMGAANGPSGNVYGYMLTDVLAQKLSEGQGMGLGRILEQQLTPRGQIAAETTPNSEQS